MYLRVISAELQRIASHLMATGFLVNDLGAFATPLMYCFRERERILDMFEMLCGARITLSYMRPGGVFQGRAGRLLGRAGGVPARHAPVRGRPGGPGYGQRDCAGAHAQRGRAQRGEGHQLLDHRPHAEGERAYNGTCARPIPTRFTTGSTSTCRLARWATRSTAT